MTAEVAVLNKSGVCLAADSAVTTGFPDREKIFTTANKIFTLSKVHPVGIMINGHVEHFGCPWEVIIKDFRNRLGTRGFDDLRGYVDLFIERARDISFLTADGQAVTVVSSGLSTLGMLESTIENTHAVWNATSIRETLEEMLEFASKQDPIPVCVNLKQRAFDAKYGSYLDNIATSDDYALRKLPKACLPLFRTVVFSVMRHQMPGSFSTGIVVAGYGNEELFPKLYEFTVDGGLLDVVRCYEVNEIDIGKEPQGAAISSFAQDDTVQEFLKGINQKFEIFHTALFTHAMGLVAEEVLREHTQLSGDERNVASAMIQRRMAEANESFQEETDEFAEDEFRSRVLEVLRSAPKESLAELAESLVSIASLRQRVSGELETVGGPVDVALISKGDGFIWIIRKHYFRPELNPHYTRNYFGEMGHGQTGKTA